VAETAGSNPTDASWSDRLFDALPVAPVWVGAGIAIGLLTLFVLLSATLGGLSDFLAGDTSFWDQREARLGVLLVILAAFVPTAERYARLGAKRHFETLLPLLDEPEARSFALRFERVDPRRRRVAGWIGFLLAPVAGLAIDRDPGLYLRAEYWEAENAWTWIVGALFCFGLGRFVDTTLGISRRFSELARALPRIDLFDPAPLAPFGQQGLLFALLWLLMPSIFALNAVDRAFAFPIAVLALLGIGVATAALLLPMLGVHRRIREAKRRARPRDGGDPRRVRSAGRIRDRAPRGEREPRRSRGLEGPGGLLGRMALRRSHASALPALSGDSRWLLARRGSRRAPAGRRSRLSLGELRSPMARCALRLRGVTESC